MISTNDINAVLVATSDIMLDGEGYSVIKAGSEFPITSVSTDTVTLGHMLCVKQSVLEAAITMNDARIDPITKGSTQRVRDTMLKLMSFMPEAQNQPMLASLWFKEDIQAVDDTIESDDDIRTVMKYMARNHNAEVGVSWDTIGDAISVALKQ